MNVFKFKTLRTPLPETLFWPLFLEKNPTKFLALLKQSRFLDNPSVLSPKFASLLLYSYTKKLPHATTSPSDLSKMQSLYNHHKNNMNKQDFVNICYSFSRLMGKNTSLFKDLEPRLQELYEEMTIRELVTIVHSFAKAQQGSLQFWKYHEENFRNLFPRLKEKELSIAIWAFSKAKISMSNEFWQKVESCVVNSNIENIELLSSIIYSFALINQGSDNLWFFFDKNIFSNLNSISTRYLANIIWSFAKVSREISNKAVYEFVQIKLIRDVKNNDIHIRDLINIIWALNKKSNQNEEEHNFWGKLFETIQEKRDLIVNSMNSQDLFNFTWIFIKKNGLHSFQLLWENLQNKFQKHLQEEVLIELKKGQLKHQEFILKSHECFYEGEKGLLILKETAENVYLQYLQAVKNNLFLGPENEQIIKENFKALQNITGKYNNINNKSKLTEELAQFIE